MNFICFDESDLKITIKQFVQFPQDFAGFLRKEGQRSTPFIFAIGSSTGDLELVRHQLKSKVGRFVDLAILSLALCVHAIVTGERNDPKSRLTIPNSSLPDLTKFLSPSFFLSCFSSSSSSSSCPLELLDNSLTSGNYLQFS